MVISQWVEIVRPTADRQQQAVQQIAGRLGDDLSEFSKRRILHLMNAVEVREASDAGLSIQLHTHRHRAPLDAGLSRVRSIRIANVLKNGRGIPRGISATPWVKWILIFSAFQQRDVQSGVTCTPGLASTKDHPLLLPRLVDSSGMSELEFLRWLAGSGAWLRAARGRSSGRQRDRLIMAACQAAIPELSIQP